MNDILTTFQLVNNDRVISPVLTTIRQYGSWFEKTFDEYTAQMELYMKSKKKTGESVLEWHPGTKIGYYFDHGTFVGDKLTSIFILQDSPMMQRLVKLGMTEQKDAIPIAVYKGQKMLRVYTIDQIQLYIKSTIDRSFDISPYLGTPKQIKVKDCDLNKVIMPIMNKQRKRLF